MTYEEGTLIDKNDMSYVQTTERSPIVQATGCKCACGEYDSLGVYVHMNLDELVTDILAEKLGIERRYAYF